MLLLVLYHKKTHLSLKIIAYQEDTMVPTSWFKSLADYQKKQNTVCQTPKALTTKKISFLHVSKGSLDPLEKQSVVHVCIGNTWALNFFSDDILCERLQFMINIKLRDVMRCSHGVTGLIGTSGGTPEMSRYHWNILGRAGIKGRSRTHDTLTSIFFRLF